MCVRADVALAPLENIILQWCCHTEKRSVRVRAGTRETPMADVVHPRIRECYPVQGDWFVVSWMYDGERGDRCWITRVVLWAALEEPRSLDRVCGIDCTGLPCSLGNPDGDNLIVYGPDLSPAGKTWLELYIQTPPNRMNIREITAALAGNPQM